MQPLIIEDNISIAANTVVENVIASNPTLKILQRLPFPAKLMFLATQSTTGLNIALDIGSSNVVASSAARIASSYPETPNDIVNGNFYGNTGDLLTLRVANTTGAAISIRYKIIAQPIGQQGEMLQLPPNDLVMQQGPISIGIGAVDTQILNGLRYERAPVDCVMDLFMTMSAAGLLRQCYVDQDRIAPATPFSTQNRMPQDPFDMTLMGIEVPGDKEIQIPVSNPTAGALNVFWKMILHQTERT